MPSWKIVFSPCREDVAKVSSSFSRFRFIFLSMVFTKMKIAVANMDASNIFSLSMMSIYQKKVCLFGESVENYFRVNTRVGGPH